MNTILDLYYEILYQIMKGIITAKNIWIIVSIIGGIVIMIFTVIYIMYQMIKQRESYSFCNIFWIIVNCSFPAIGAFIYWIFEKIFCSKRKRGICKFHFKKMLLIPIACGYVLVFILGYIPINSDIMNFNSSKIVSICIFSTIIVTICLLVEMIFLLIVSSMNNVSPFLYSPLQDDVEMRIQAKSRLHYGVSKKKTQSEKLQGDINTIKYVAKEEMDRMILYGIESNSGYCDASYYQHGESVKVCYLENDFYSITMSFFTSVILMMGVIFPTILYILFIIK